MSGRWFSTCSCTSSICSESLPEVWQDLVQLQSHSTWLRSTKVSRSCQKLIQAELLQLALTCLSGSSTRNCTCWFHTGAPCLLAVLVSLSLLLATAGTPTALQAPKNRTRVCLGLAHAAPPCPSYVYQVAICRTNTCIVQLLPVCLGLLPGTALPGSTQAPHVC